MCQPYANGATMASRKMKHRPTDRFPSDIYLCAFSGVMLHYLLEGFISKGGLFQ